MCYLIEVDCYRGLYCLVFENEDFSEENIFLNYIIKGDCEREPVMLY